MDTSIDKPIKRPVPKPITGQFPKRGANGRFLRGASGNPKGRPLGSRNRASLLMEDLLDGRAKALTEKAIEKALAGDVFALRVCLDRMMPVRRERSLTLHLPARATAQDIAGGFASVVEALAHGELRPSETSVVRPTLLCLWLRPNEQRAPEARSKIAQRFIAGKLRRRNRVP